jgi:hypothetical protein
MAIGRTSVPSNKPMLPSAHASPFTNPTRLLRRHIGQSLGGLAPPFPGKGLGREAGADAVQGSGRRKEVGRSRGSDSLIGPRR